MTAVGCSSSWANRSGATGSTATITIASIARTVSVSTSFIVISTLVVVDGDRAGRHGLEPTCPQHIDLAELLALIQLDDALLEQLSSARKRTITSSRSTGHW
jgi:hypothetical protein